MNNYKAFHTEYETCQHDHPWRPKDLFVEPVDGATLHVIAKLDGAVLLWKLVAAVGWVCAGAMAGAVWRGWL